MIPQSPQHHAGANGSGNGGDFPQKLSFVLTELLAKEQGCHLTIGQLQTALRGRGVAMLLILLSLPFCFIPIPGLSTPFGVAVVLLGFRIMLGQTPWLPRLIRDRILTASRVGQLLTGGIRFARTMEKLVKPRMQFLHRWPGAMNLIGLSIVLGGLILLLPLPIPFSNTLPAWAIVLLAAGMMERDGVLVLVGHLLTLLSWAFIALAWHFGAEGVEKLLGVL